MTDKKNPKKERNKMETYCYTFPILYSNTILKLGGLINYRNKKISRLKIQRSKAGKYTMMDVFRHRKTGCGRSWKDVLVVKEPFLLLQWARVQFPVTSFVGDLMPSSDFLRHLHRYTHTPPYKNISINIIKDNKNKYFLKET